MQQHKQHLEVVSSEPSAELVEAAAVTSVSEGLAASPQADDGVLAAKTAPPTVAIQSNDSL